MKVRILLSNPLCERLHYNGHDWFIFTAIRDELLDRVPTWNTVEEAISDIEDLTKEYSLMSVDYEEQKITAYRGITSSYDIFFQKPPWSSQLTLSDHIRELIVELPPHCRTIRPEASVDQMLFGTSPFSPPIQEIGRVRHGEIIEFKPSKNSVEKKNRTTISPMPSRSPTDVIDGLNRYFTNHLDGSFHPKTTATMLSGGVDSTLLHTYRDSNETVSAAWDSQEFEVEKEYAEEASELLRSDHSLLEVKESDFINQVEDATDVIGLPLKHLQTTLINTLVSRTPYDSFINAQLADGIFGVENTRVYKLAWWVRYLLKYLPHLSKLKSLKDLALSLEKPPSSPCSAAMGFVRFTDEASLSKLCSKSLIESRMKKRFSYVRDRSFLRDERGYHSNMHVGHLIDFFLDNTITPWRHCAQAYGKNLITPFGGQRVLKLALSLPPSRRYVKGLRPKYILKDLLKSRLPEYETDKGKGDSGPPLRRWVKNGPLSDCFNHYPLPDFISSNDLEEATRHSSHAHWYLFAYAVWKSRIIENENLDHFDSTTVVDLDIR